MSRRGGYQATGSGRYRSYERRGRAAIPRNDGRAGFLESAILLTAMVALAVALGFTVGLPLMLMLSDICAQLKC